MCPLICSFRWETSKLPWDTLGVGWRRGRRGLSRCVEGTGGRTFMSDDHGAGDGHRSCELELRWDPSFRTIPGWGPSSQTVNQSPGIVGCGGKVGTGGLESALAGLRRLALLTQRCLWPGVQAMPSQHAALSCHVMFLCALLSNS